MNRNDSLIRPTQFAAIFLLGALFAGPVMAAGAPTDQDIDMSYMWDLTELFATPEAWTEAHDRIRADADGLDSLQGSLGQSASTMLAGLDAISDVQKDLARLYVYSSLKADEDLGDAPNQERRQQAGARSCRSSAGRAARPPPRTCGSRRGCRRCWRGRGGCGSL